MRIRSSLTLSLVLAAALPAVVGAQAASSSPRAASPVCPGCTAPTFLVSGRGWGHGVGMGQYGALGFARAGSTYDRILAHYYQGTTLGPAPVKRVRVLLDGAQRTLTISSQSPFRVVDGEGKRHALPAAPQKFGPGLRLRAEGAKKAKPLPGPLLFLPGAEPLELKRPYRGQIRVTVERGRLRAVNVVGLESYLYGVVPAEMPHTWAPEALKAQAVAARTYALATRKSGEFDLYSDVRSQVYRGVDEEEPQTNAAIDATAGQVVLYDGKLAHTYFFSTSGGRTASVADVWSGGEAFPYLVSVSDPYDSLSPYHQWGPFAFGAEKIARKLKVPGEVVDVRTTQNGSGRTRDVIATGTLGEVSVRSAIVRRELGLRSTWFRIGMLALSKPAALPVVYGAGTKLSGLARNVAPVYLEQRAAGSTWRGLDPVAVAKDGTFAIPLKPLVTSYYRLAVGKARSAAVRLPVAPLVRFHPGHGPSVLRGTARPILPDATIEVQRLEGEAWVTVAKAALDAKGEFEASLQVTPGSYRARFAPGRGFVPGTSPVLKVVPA